MSLDENNMKCKGFSPFSLNLSLMILAEQFFLLEEMEALRKCLIGQEELDSNDLL